MLEKRLAYIIVHLDPSKNHPFWTFLNNYNLVEQKKSTHEELWSFKQAYYACVTDVSSI